MFGHNNNVKLPIIIPKPLSFVILFLHAVLQNVVCGPEFIREDSSESNFLDQEDLDSVDELISWTEDIHLSDIHEYEYFDLPLHVLI